MAFKGCALLLSLFCILVFTAQIAIPSLTENFILNSASWSEPWRFITSIFLHGSTVHLLYNIFALALFGTILETILGGKRFIVIFFITGIMANLATIWFYNAALGASGAIFGIIGSLIVLRPKMTVWAFSLPMPMALAGIIWATGDLIGLFVPDDTAHIAHLAGLTLGILIGLFYRTPEPISFSHSKIKLDENTMRNWEDSYLK